MEILAFLFGIMILLVVFTYLWDIFLFFIMIIVNIFPSIIGILLCVSIWASGHDNIGVIVLLGSFIGQGVWSSSKTGKKTIESVGKLLGNLFIPPP